MGAMACRPRCPLRKSTRHLLLDGAHRERCLSRRIIVGDERVVVVVGEVGDVEVRARLA